MAVASEGNKAQYAGGSAEIPAGGAGSPASVLAKWGHVEEVRPRAALASDALLGLTCSEGARPVWHTVLRALVRLLIGDY